MRASIRLLPRVAPLLLAPMLAIATPTTASAATDGRFCLLGLTVLGTGVEFLCREPEAPAVVDTACRAFEPIRWSRNDTPDTVAQAKAHNAAWRALCEQTAAGAGTP
jgi:hypothetical protein